MIYAVWHAFVAEFIRVNALNELGVNQSNGQIIGFWVGGLTTYGTAIFMANFMLGI